MEPAKTSTWTGSVDAAVASVEAADEPKVWIGRLTGEKIDSVESALREAWAFCAQEEGLERVRRALDRGTEIVEYRVKIYRHPVRDEFTVRVEYLERRAETHPLKFQHLQ